MQFDRMGSSPTAGQGDGRSDSYRWAACSCALALFAALLGSTAPSPLYPIYASQWSLGQAMINAVFAVYAIGTLLCLVIVGLVGDRVRTNRQLLLPALGLVAAGALLMAAAFNPIWLLVGRFLAGAGTGIITATAPAAFHELLAPAQRKQTAMITTLAFTAGAACGPLLSAAAIALDLRPTLSPYAVIAAVAAAAASGILFAKWPPPRKRRRAGNVAHADLLTYGSPLAAQALAYLAIAVSWMIGSTIMAVGTRLALDLFGAGSVALAGLLPAAFQLFGGAGQTLFGFIDRRSAALYGLAGLALSQLVLWIAADAQISVALIFAIPLCGLAYGAAFVGAAGLINETVAPDKRSAATSRFYIVGYLANAVPVLALGAFIDAVGLSLAFYVFSATVIFLAMCGVFLALRTLALRRRDSVKACG